MSSASEGSVPIRLTHSLRKLAAELLPQLADRLALDSRHQRTLLFTVADANQLKDQAASAVRKSWAIAVMSMLGYIGAFQRYLSRKSAPVAKDMVNYMGESTQPGLKAMGKAVAEGVMEAQNETHRR